MVAIACLSLQGCTKQDIVDAIKKVIPSSASKENPQDQLKLNTIKKMYAENLKHQSGNETLYHYATDQFKSLMDLSNEYTRTNQDICGYNEDLLMNSQDPDYSKTDYQYSVNSSGQVVVKLPSKQEITFDLQCQDNSCQINDVLNGTVSISKAIETDCSLAPKNNEQIQTASASNALIEQQPTPTITAPVLPASDTSPIKIIMNPMPSHEVGAVISIQSTVQEITLNDIKVNRGNCPLLESVTLPVVIQSGDSFTVEDRCPLDQIKEVTVYTTQGNWAFRN